MSNLSIFDKKWLDVVFDGKNKEYGAYQLRQETQKTSLRAFAFGTLIVFSCIGIFTLSSFFSADNVVVSNEAPGIVVKLTDFKYPVEEIKKPEVKIDKVKTERIFSKNIILKNPIVASNVTTSIATAIDLGKITNDPNIDNGFLKPENPVDDGNTTVFVPEVKVTNNRIVDRKALDKQPTFPGGIQIFYNYVGNNFEKPELNEETTMTVKVSFIVEKDGSMSNIKVLEDPGYGLGQEAIRVLKSLNTNWNAGILDGEPVRTFYNLPITIKLD